MGDKSHATHVISISDQEARKRIAVLENQITQLSTAVSGVLHAIQVVDSDPYCVCTGCDKGAMVTQEKGECHNPTCPLGMYIGGTVNEIDS